MKSSGANAQGVDLRVEGKYLSNGQGNPKSGIDRVFFTCMYEVLLGGDVRGLSDSIDLRSIIYTG